MARTLAQLDAYVTAAVTELNRRLHLVEDASADHEERIRLLEIFGKQAAPKPVVR